MALRKIIGRLLGKIKRVLGWRSEDSASPDSMAAQALEEVAEEHKYSDSSFGLVKTSPDLRGRLLASVSEHAGRFIESLEIRIDGDLQQDIKEFFSIQQHNPARDARKGATGDGLLLWLFLLTRQLHPDTVVESGSWVGRSLYVLRKAAPEAELHAFDPSFSRLLYRDESIRYHEHDWAHSDVRAQEKGLCYFDDHINNGQRIREAYERGFRHLIFDQCAPVGMVHPFRYPGLPSALMLANDALNEGDELEWTWKDKKLRYRYEESHSHGAKDLIELAKPLPSLEAWIGESPGQAAYVRLKTTADS